MLDYKCQTCCHSSVCALRKNYEQFINEIKEKEKLLEFKAFVPFPFATITQYIKLTQKI